MVKFAHLYLQFTVVSVVHGQSSPLSLCNRDQYPHVPLLFTASHILCLCVTGIIILMFHCCSRPVISTVSVRQGSVSSCSTVVHGQTSPLCDRDQYPHVPLLFTASHILCLYVTGISILTFHCCSWADISSV